MKYFSKHSWEVFDAGGNGNFSCSSLQFPVFNSMFSTQNVTFDDDDDVKKEEEVPSYAAHPMGHLPLLHHRLS